MERFGGFGALCPRRDPARAEKPQLSRERSSQGLLLAQPLEPRQEFAMGTGLSRSCRDLPCLRGFGHTQKFRASEKKPSAPGQGRGRERRNHFSAEESQGDSGSDAGSKEGREWWGEGGQPWRGWGGQAAPLPPVPRETRTVGVHGVFSAAAKLLQALPTFTCLRTSSKGPQISFVPAFLRLVKSRCSTKSCPRPTERQFTLEKRGYKTPGASFPALPELIMEPKGSVTSLGRRREVGMEDPTMDIRFGAFGGFGVWNCKERSKTAPVQCLGCGSTLDLQPLPLHNG